MLFKLTVGYITLYLPKHNGRIYKGNTISRWYGDTGISKVWKEKRRRKKIYKKRRRRRRKKMKRNKKRRRREKDEDEK